MYCSSMTDLASLSNALASSTEAFRLLLFLRVSVCFYLHDPGFHRGFFVRKVSELSSISINSLIRALRDQRSLAQFARSGG